nr:DUF4386 domain-containing protein [Micromonospora sp. DSM 115978]
MWSAIQRRPRRRRPGTGHGRHPGPRGRLVHRLFRTAHPLAAHGIVAFGLVVATVGLVGAALLGTAVRVAVDPVGDPAATVQVLYLVSDNLWGVGALFFGLWLIPMGWCVLCSGWMPRALGWILVAGGVGYALGAFLRYLAPDAYLAVEVLAFPAHIGEFWMVGYLLIFDVRRPAVGSVQDGPGAGF